MANEIISLCFIEKNFEKRYNSFLFDSSSSNSFCQLSDYCLKGDNFWTKFIWMLSAVLSYHKNIVEKKFNTAQKFGKKNFFSRELTFANWMFQDFSWGPTFEILAKNPKITKISSFKVLNWSGPHWSKITENRVSNNWTCRRNSDF